LLSKLIFIENVLKIAANFDEKYLALPFIGPRNRKDSTVDISRRCAKRFSS